MSKPPPTDKDAIDRVIARGVGAPGRSSIYRWLWQNHARLAPQFEGVRVSWSGVAETLAELGIMDAGGRPPKAEAVRRAWGRVRRDVSKAREIREAREAARSAATSAPDPSPAPVLPGYDPHQGYSPGVEPVGEHEPSRSTFRVSAGLKKWTNPTKAKE